ncbi:MAG: hypothetical protein F4W95_09295 [Chloroflexi bacterium]|nr:hypothetical protein [Chloroflexota bacterium]MYD48663.1 hypothetical protein [Chloroflexota bacterium]
MTFNKEDTPAIGRAIYQEKIRPTLGPEHKGKIVVIDVKSGDYEIADEDLVATRRLRERQPNAYTWAERVGYPAVYKMGARFRSVNRD